MTRYINPYTDFGFKKLFGEEANKDLLMDFLNQLLPPEHQIAELAFRNTEQLPDLPPERRAIFDINCISTSGERFIVEMQKAKIHFLNEPIFQKAFSVAEVANLSREQYGAYEQNLLDYWGIKAAVDTAYDEGREEGLQLGAEQRARDTARKMLAEGYAAADVAGLTGLTPEQIDQLANDDGHPSASMAEGAPAMRPNCPRG